MVVKIFFLLLPLALAVPEKRLILDSFLDLDKLKSVLSPIAHQYGDNPTEAQCEAGCHDLMVDEQSLGHVWCPAICRSFQELMRLLDMETTTPPTTSSPLEGS